MKKESIEVVNTSSIDLSNRFAIWGLHTITQLILNGKGLTSTGNTAYDKCHLNVCSDIEMEKYFNRCQ